MANKNVKNTKTKQSAATRSSGAQRSGAQSPKGAKGKPVQKNIKAQQTAPLKVKKDHSALKSAMPYILMLVGLVLAICFFTVQILGMDDGAGVVGYAIQYFFCGLFGFSAFLIPIVLLYIGIKWCVYNVKMKSTSDGDELEVIKLTRKRNILQTVMAVLLIVCLSMLIAIFAGECEEFDIAGMWEDAAEDLSGGGVIGGSLAVLMVMAFEAVISSVIIIFVMIFVVIFMIGLTPDRVILYIRQRNQIRREEKIEAMAAAALEEEEARREEAKRANRLRATGAQSAETAETVEASGQGSKRANAASMSVDEMVGVEAEDAVIFDAPEQKQIYISPADEQKGEAASLKPSETVEESEAEADVGEDFGGDPVFDNTEVQGISSVIANLRSEGEIVAEQTDGDGDIEMELIVSEELLSDIAAVAPDEALDEEPVEVVAPYVFPPMDMLEKNKNTQQADFTQELQENAKILMETLKTFKVNIREITYSRGPTITRYELKPEAGTRVRAIANLVDDIALNLATSGVRIEAPIPNKPAVGIEVPNRDRATVYLRDLIESSKFTDAKSKVTSSLGMDVGGNPIYFDIAKMPHLLIAGATGMGKSVCINSIIVSILYKAKPDEVKLILVDPKKVEFNIYKDIPHLYAPIVSDPKKAAGALASAVAEMERRFELIEEVGVRDIATYNAVTENDPDREFMPQMVIIIDKLADLMMTAPDEVEASICRLAQKARAAGIHIIIGTQRPSVDVITGLIKANIPSRIACTVASQIDSRTILDMAGAEKLIGRGDMLFSPVGAAKPMRVQGAFVSEAEVERIVSFIKENNSKAKYNSDFISRIEEEAAKCGAGKKGASAEFDADAELEGGDSKFRDAVKLAIDEGKISTSLMQRRLGVGYGRAAKIIDTMEEMGYVTKPDGNKPRRVLITMEEYSRRVMSGELGSADGE